MSQDEVPLRVDVQDILPIIKSFMYSDREIFLRELVSNSIDALQKFSHLTLLNQAQPGEAELLCVEVKLDRVNLTVTIIDNGIGMSREEVIRYINQIAFSGAKEFIEQYSKAGSNLIGRFGLGFYSSFMVSERVEIDTLSLNPAGGGCHWSCDGGPQARLSINQRQQRGTTVVCRLLEDAKEFMEVERLERVIRHYLDYAPFPIFLGSRQVNVVTAPWHLSAAERASLPRQSFWDVYERLNPGQNRPLAWFDVEIDYPVQARALFFVPDSAERGSVRLFANRTFVCDDSAELLPEWLHFLDGVVDSPDVPINVTRDRFQKDRNVSLLRGHLSVKAVAFLAEFFARQRADYVRIWERYGAHLKIGFLESLEDEHNGLCERLESLLMFPSSRRPLTTIKEYLQRCSDADRTTVIYVTDAQAQHAHLELLKNRNREVLHFTERIDPVLARAFAQIHTEWSFVRADQVGVVDSAETAEPHEAKQQAEVDCTQITDLFRELAGSSATRVSFEPLPSQDIPAVLNLTEQAALEDDLGRVISGAVRPKQKYVLTLNSSCELIRALARLGGLAGSGDLPIALVAQVWDNVRLGAGLLEGDELRDALQRSRDFLLLVANRILQSNDE